MATQPVENIEAVLGRFQAWAGVRNEMEAGLGIREIPYEEALASGRYQWKGASAAKKPGAGVASLGAKASEYVGPASGGAKASSGAEAASARAKASIGAEVESGGEKVAAVAPTDSRPAKAAAAAVESRRAKAPAKKAPEANPRGAKRMLVRGRDKAHGMPHGKPHAGKAAKPEKACAGSRSKRAPEAKGRGERHSAAPKTKAEDRRAAKAPHGDRIAAKAPHMHRGAAKAAHGEKRPGKPEFRDALAADSIAPTITKGERKGPEFRDALAAAARPAETAEAAMAARRTEMVRQAAISIRLAPSERELIQMRAAETGITASAYIRQCALDVEELRAQVCAAVSALGHWNGASATPGPAPVSTPGIFARILRRLFGGGVPALALRA